jgi:hypothetical protein
MTTTIRRASFKSPNFTGFEPGAKIASDSPPAAPATLTTAPGEDHFAPIETRRLSMLDDVYARLKAAKAKVGELQQRAAVTRAERDKLLVMGAMDRANELHGDAARLELEASTLKQSGIPDLEFEAAQIGSGNHPTLQNMRLVAMNRTGRDLIERNNRISNNLVAARAAFTEHLRMIGTPETLTLAQSIADAVAAANAIRQASAPRLEVDALLAGLLAPPKAAA